MAYINPDLLQEDWDALGTWDDGDAGGGVSDISPAGQLYLDCRAVDPTGRAYRSKDFGTIGTGDYYIELRFSGDVWDNTADISESGIQLNVQAETKQLLTYIGNDLDGSTDGIWVMDSGGTKTKVLTKTWDTSFHVITFFVHNSQTDVDIWIDTDPATEAADVTDADCSHATATDGFTAISGRGSAAGNGEYHIDYLYVGTRMIYTMAVTVGEIALTGIANILTSARTLICSGGEIATLDSYSESNHSAFFYLYNGGNNYIGQSFTNVNATILDSCKFYLNKNGTITGSAYAKLYSEKHNTAYGVDSVPDQLLATSDAFDVSGLTADLQLITFNFSEANKIILNALTYYVIVLNYSVSVWNNRLQCSVDITTPTHSGNRISSSNGIDWTATSDDDAPFYVYGIAPTFLLTGIDNILTRGYGIIADVGSFTLTGIDAIITSARTMAVAVGEFTLTGIATTLTSARSIVAGVGQFILTGFNVVFKGFWQYKTKNTTSWTNKTKNATTYTQKSKNDTSWTYKTKE